MTAIEPDVSLTGRYPIGETCALLGIHRNTLRTMTKRGIIKCRFRKDGRKVYMGSEILRFFKSEI